MLVLGSLTLGLDNFHTATPNPKLQCSCNNRGSLEGNKP